MVTFVPFVLTITLFSLVFVYSFGLDCRLLFTSNTMLAPSVFSKKNIASDRTLDLECQDQAQRDFWVGNSQRLLQHLRQQQ